MYIFFQQQQEEQMQPRRGQVVSWARRDFSKIREERRNQATYQVGAVPPELSPLLAAELAIFVSAGETKRQMKGKVLCSGFFTQVSDCDNGGELPARKRKHAGWWRMYMYIQQKGPFSAVRMSK